jgi:hypothetical protein
MSESKLLGRRGVQDTKDPTSGIQVILTTGSQASRAPPICRRPKRRICLGGVSVNTEVHFST